MHYIPTSQTDTPLVCDLQLLKRFDIAVVNPIKPWTSICYGIFFQEDFHVTVTRRGHGQRRLAE